MKILNTIVSNEDIANLSATISFDIVETTEKVEVQIKINESEYQQIFTEKENETLTYDIKGLRIGLNYINLKLISSTEEYVTEVCLIKLKKIPTINNLINTYSNNNGEYILGFNLSGDENFKYTIYLKMDENEYVEIMNNQIIGNKTYTGNDTVGFHTCYLKATDSYDEVETSLTFEIKNQPPKLSKVIVTDINGDSCKIHYTAKDDEGSPLTFNLSINGNRAPIAPSSLNYFYSYEITNLPVGLNTCILSVSDGTDTVNEEFSIEVFNDTSNSKELLYQSKILYDNAYQQLRNVITSIVSDMSYDYDTENGLIEKCQEEYNIRYSNFNKIAQQSVDVIGTNKIAISKRELQQEINDVDSAINDLEGTMNGVFKDGILDEAEKSLLDNDLDLIAKEKSDIDRDYDTLYNNKDLLNPAKSSLQNAYEAFIIAHNALIASIVDLVNRTDIINSEDRRNIDALFEAWRNALGDYRSASLGAIDSVAKKKADDSSDVVDKKWAEIILDPDNGIQSVVGSLSQKISGSGGIEERLQTAEQTITTEGISNLIKDVYYSKQEVDVQLEATVASVKMQYYLSTSTTELIGGTWTDVAPTWERDKYMWSRTVTVLTDGTVKESVPACIAGAKGEDGTGINLLGSYDTLEELLEAHPSGNSMGDAYIVGRDLYVWNGTTFNNIGEIKGENGENGKDGVSYYTWVKYADDENGTNMSDEPGDRPYIGIAYNKTTLEESNNPEDYTWSSMKGGKIEAIIPEYYLSTSNSSQMGGAWTETAPSWKDNTYMWTRSKIMYENSTTVEYTTPILDETWGALKDLQDEIENNKAEMQTTREQIAEHTTQLGSITSSVSSNTSNITTLNGEMVSIEGRVTSAEEKITEEAITNVVKNEFYTKGETDTRMSAVTQTIDSWGVKINQNESDIASLKLTDEEFEVVIGGKADTSNIISIINASAEGITIDSSKVNITGLVTFNNLSGAGQTVINGGNITTGTINASLVNVINLNASNITSGTIDASDINVININASNITSGFISGSRINGGVITGAQFRTYTRTSQGGVEIQEDALHIGFTTFHYADSRFKIESNANFSLSSMAGIYIMAGITQGGATTGNGNVYVYDTLRVSKAIYIDGVQVKAGGTTAVFG